MTSPIKCAKCGADVDPLAVFPQKRCLSCYEKDMAGAPMPTAREIVAMWGGRTR